MAESEGMIEPFQAGQVRYNDAGERLISYGTSSYGYDVRCADEFKIFYQTFTRQQLIQRILMKIVLSILRQVSVLSRLIPLPWRAPLNTFVFPRSVLTICLGKSTYARCGIIVNVTPIGAGSGKGMSRLSSPIQQHCRPKFMQTKASRKCYFLSLMRCADVSYKDRGGKYQGQTGVTLPKT